MKLIKTSEFEPQKLHYIVNLASINKCVSVPQMLEMLNGETTTKTTVRTETLPSTLTENVNQTNLPVLLERTY